MNILQKTYLAMTGESISPETFSHAAGPVCLVLKAGLCAFPAFFGPPPLLPRKLATGKIKVLCAFKDMPRSDEVLDRVLPSGSEALEGRTSANGIFGGRRVDMKEAEKGRQVDICSLEKASGSTGCQNVWTDQVVVSLPSRSRDVVTVVVEDDLLVTAGGDDEHGEGEEEKKFDAGDAHILYVWTF